MRTTNEIKKKKNIFYKLQLTRKIIKKKKETNFRFKKCISFS